MVDKKYFGVASQQVTLGPGSIKKISGKYLSAALRYLQLHDSNAVPAEGAVPKESWDLSGGDAAAPVDFFQTFIDGKFECVNGVYLCLSSTDGTKTIDAAASMDLFVELEREDPYLGATVAGDVTTAVDALQVWTEATGAATPKKLLRVEASWNSVDPSLYLLLFAKTLANVALLEKPIWSSVALTDDGANRVMGVFGAGFGPFSADADGTKRAGCLLAFSTDKTKYQPPGTTPGTIKAIYR